MKNVPNALTISRIIVTPILLVLLMSETFTGQAVAFVLFVLAAISDYLDGKLARSYQVRSRLGQFLDPLADKVLVLGTFVALAVLDPATTPWWAVALIAVRDLSVTGLRTWAEAKGRSIRTRSAARYKTAAQLTYLIGMLLLLALSGLTGGGWLAQVQAGAAWMLASPIPFGVLVVVVVITLWTGALYFTNLEYAQPIAPPTNPEDRAGS